MSASRGLLAAVVVGTAVLVQTTLVGRLELPYGRPDLIVVVVVVLGIACGATTGMSAGFAAGLLADLLSDHPAGLLALVLCVAGFACGLLPLSERRPGAGSALWPALVAVAVAAMSVMIGFAALLAILGSPRLDWRVVAGELPGSAAYDVVLALVVLPAVTAMCRRLDPAGGGRG